MGGGGTVINKNSKPTETSGVTSKTFPSSQLYPDSPQCSVSTLAISTAGTYAVMTVNV